ncbi:MAG: hypothetical protein F6J93_09805 [Oscillatoria sp. SIO1A7]|nr:hypothetical protein [Oscillatoria sp. SIO1A7]
MAAISPKIPKKLANLCPIVRLPDRSLLYPPDRSYKPNIEPQQQLYRLPARDIQAKKKSCDRPFGG